jgi:hypothetical protein
VDFREVLVGDGRGLVGMLAYIELRHDVLIGIDREGFV